MAFRVDGFCGVGKPRVGRRTVAGGSFTLTENTRLGRILQPEVQILGRSTGVLQSVEVKSRARRRW